MDILVRHADFVESTGGRLRLDLTDSMPYPRIIRQKSKTDAPKFAIDNAYAFTDALSMNWLPVTQARAQLYDLLDRAAASHEPIHISGKRSNAVLVSEEDWRSIQETLHLLSIPGMRESIRKGMAEPLDKASTKPGW